MKHSRMSKRSRRSFINSTKNELYDQLLNSIECLGGDQRDLSTYQNDPVGFGQEVCNKISTDSTSPGHKYCIPGSGPTKSGQVSDQVASSDIGKANSYIVPTLGSENSMFILISVSFASLTSAFTLI